MKKKIGLLIIAFMSICMYIIIPKPIAYIFLVILVLSLIEYECTVVPIQYSKEDEYLYKGWLKIIRVKHNNKTYEKLIMHDSVVGLVINQDGKILLVKQFRPALGKYTLELPGGFLDKKGESEIDTLIRKLGEEADIIPVDIISTKLIKKYNSMSNCSDSVTSIYLVNVKTHVMNKEIKNDNVESIIWVTYNELKDLINKEII